jgi:LPS sulfotransferase NodH
LYGQYLFQTFKGARSVIRQFRGFVVNTASGRFLPPDMTPFVIIFTPRTGSNYLAAMLDSHPEILCHHELFNRDGIHRSLSYKNTDLTFGTIADRNRDPWGFLRRVYAFRDGAKAVGFKLGPRTNDLLLLSLLLVPRVRKVVLARRSWLHAYTSELIAARTQRWMERGAGTENQLQPKVRVDTQQYRGYVRKRRLFYRLCEILLRLTRQECFRLDYEQVGEPATMAALLGFLGVAVNVPLHSGTTRQNSPNLEDRIENYEEIRIKLRDSPDDPVN